MLNRQALASRKARTRTLIQGGGLLSLAGLFGLCHIEEGEDLQLDMHARDKAATLLGILLETSQNICEPVDDQQRERWKASGIRLLKQSTAKNVYRS